MKVTAELTDKAKAYYNEVAYGLDFGDGKCATQTQVINYMIETLSDIEEKFGDPVSYLKENGKDFGTNNLYKPQRKSGNKSRPL